MENAALCFVPESVLDVALGAGCSTVGVAGLGSRVHGSARCGTVWHGAVSGRLPSLAVCTVWHLARCGIRLSFSGVPSAVPPCVCVSRHRQAPPRRHHCAVARFARPKLGHNYRPHLGDHVSWPTQSSLVARRLFAPRWSSRFEAVAASLPRCSRRALFTHYRSNHWSLPSLSSSLSSSIMFINFPSSVRVSIATSRIKWRCHQSEDDDVCAGAAFLLPLLALLPLPLPLMPVAPLSPDDGPDSSPAVPPPSLPSLSSSLSLPLPAPPEKW